MYYLYTHEELDVATRSSLNGFARSAKIHGRSKMKVNELRDALRERLPPREGTSPGLFVELCAGTAAVSLQLHREGARPPVSRMGSKRGYAVAVLHALGLYPGLQADHYLWCEPDDGCRLLLETYRDHDLALKVAEIIRGWKDEDPRSLWERLRKEGPVKAPTPREVGRWCMLEAWTMCDAKPIYSGPGRQSGTTHWQTLPGVGGQVEDLPVLPAEVTQEAIDPREVARWTLALPGGAWTAMPPKAIYKGPGSQASTHWQTLPGVVARYEDLPALPGEVKEEAVDPREVARWTLALPGGAWTAMPPKPIYKGPGCWPSRPEANAPHPIPNVAARYEDLPTFPGEITDGAVEPPLLPPNTVVYIDPPYVNTTGYKHDLPRERVVELALAWYAAGAKVAISEQEAIPELIAQGWTAVDITDKRLGQKRTFSNQQKEYLTLSPGTKC